MAFALSSALRARPRPLSHSPNWLLTCSQSNPDARNAARSQNTASPAAAQLTNNAPGFCRSCASPLQYQVPPGDERKRLVCSNCAAVLYENPKLVVSCVPVSVDGCRVLLGKRAAAPIGKWTIPAGFLESGETTHDGAARETLEEMGAVLDMRRIHLFAVYNVLPANQVQLVYRCTLLNELEIAPGIEMEQVRMFEWSSIPWEELAFPTVKWALEYSLDNLESEQIQPQMKSR
ncbi:unnamed protein product [Agarophyton chilense]